MQPPVAMYSQNIQGRTVSVPAKIPWSMTTMNVGAARRWSRRHHALPMRFLIHDDASTTAIPYIATIPNVTSLGGEIARLEGELKARLEQHPDAEILRSLPGLGLILGAPGARRVRR
jgi:transposase